MDRLDAMQLFVRVAELGSFSAAAQQMGVARSVVTRQIAALEAHLGIKLMARSTRRLTLNSAGTAYLDSCRDILNRVEAAELGLAQDRQTPRGNIHLSLPLSYGRKRVAPLLLDFSNRYPQVTLDLDFSDRRINLIEEGIDLAIRVTRRLDAGDVTRRIGTSHLQVLAAPQYLQRRGTPGHPRELIGHSCLGYTHAGSAMGWPFMIEGQLVNFPVRSSFNANNGEVLTEAAAQGLGLTCQPDFIAQDYLASARVVEVLRDYPAPELGIYAVLPSNRQVPHRVRVLMDHLAEGLAAATSANSL